MIVYPILLSYRDSHFDRNITPYFRSYDAICIQRKVKVKIVDENNHPNSIKIPDKLYDGFKKLLSKEKKHSESWYIDQPFLAKNYLIGYFTFQRQDPNGNCFRKNMILVLSVMGDYRSEINKYLKKTWKKLLKFYDEKVGVK